MSDSELRVLVFSGGDPLTSELMQSLHTVPGVVPVSRTLDALRDLAAMDGRAVQHDAAVSLVVDTDVVLVVVHDNRSIVDAPSLSVGVALLAEIGAPVMLLQAFGNESEADFVRAGQWISRHVRSVVSVDARLDELLHALRLTAAGMAVLDARVAAALSPRVTRRRATAVAVRRSGQALSPRECEVLSLLAEGHATKTIARALQISSHTVKAHVESIFEKLGVTTRAEAVAVGVRRGDVML